DPMVLHYKDIISRDSDVADQIVKEFTVNPNVRIVVIRGAFHTPLQDMLANEGLSVRSFVSKRAKTYLPATLVEGIRPFVDQAIQGRAQRKQQALQDPKKGSDITSKDIKLNTPLWLAMFPAAFVLGVDNWMSYAMVASLGILGIADYQTWLVTVFNRIKQKV